MGEVRIAFVFMRLTTVKIVGQQNDQCLHTHTLAHTGMHKQGMTPKEINFHMQKFLVNVPDTSGERDREREGAGAGKSNFIHKIFKLRCINVA